MKLNLIILSTISMIFIFMSCDNNCKSGEEWQIVFRNDAEGNDLYGDKNTLIDAVRMGVPIRVGFGGSRKTDTLVSVEHTADAQFLTITNGKEVFAQITPIFGQKPFLDSDTLRIAIKHENKWTLIVGTNGESSTLSRYFDEEKTAPSRQSRRGATWYAKLPKSNNEILVMPLWD